MATALPSLTNVEPDFCRFRWENPDNLRYYEALLSQDLFGDWLLQRIWGKRYTAMGQIRKTLCKDFNDGIQQIITVNKRRKSHGYIVVLQHGISIF